MGGVKEEGDTQIRKLATPEHYLDEQLFRFQLASYKCDLRAQCCDSGNAKLLESHPRRSSRSSTDQHFTEQELRHLYTVGLAYISQYY